jgi:hypothetical protein
VAETRVASVNPRAINHVIDTVTDAGWPAIFALVDDRFWQVARLPAIRRPMARAWAWLPADPRVGFLVQAIDGAAAGAALRQLRLGPRISSARLTQATAKNGCCL